MAAEVCLEQLPILLSDPAAEFQVLSNAVSKRCEYSLHFVVLND
jgi:hypothetical protein